MPVLDCGGKHKQLDIDACANLLRELTTEQSGEKVRNLLVEVFEQSPITPLFEAKNHFLNGQNNEFWRVLLARSKLPHTWVNPKVWQNHVFAGIRGDDTKVKAAIACRRRFPNFSPQGYPSQLVGVIDAICIALWARETGR